MHDREKNVKLMKGITVSIFLTAGVIVLFLKSYINGKKSIYFKN